MWGAAFGRLPTLEFFEHAGAKKTFHQRHHPPVGDPLFDPRHQPVVRNGVEVAFQVGIDHPGVAALEERVHAAQRVFGPAPRSEAVTVLGEFRLEDRFQDVPQGGLHNAVAHRRNAQRSLFLAAGLGYPSPSGRVWAVGVLSQLLVQPGQLGFGVPGEMREGLSVGTRAAPVLPDLGKGTVQIGGGVGLVHQTEPDSGFPRESSGSVAALVRSQRS